MLHILDEIWVAFGACPGKALQLVAGLYSDGKNVAADGFAAVFWIGFFIYIDFAEVVVGPHIQLFCDVAVADDAAYVIPHIIDRSTDKRVGTSRIVRIIDQYRAVIAVLIVIVPREFCINGRIADSGGFCASGRGLDRLNGLSLCVHRLERRLIKGIVNIRTRTRLPDKFRIVHMAEIDFHNRFFTFLTDRALRYNASVGSVSADSCGRRKRR